MVGLRTADPVGFGGQFGCYTDLETGLVLMTYRYYDAVACRFLTRDPAGYAAGVNPYAYCGGNPVTSADPLGLSPFWGSDLLTGIGDGASGGIARPIRSWIGNELGIGDPNAYVDTDSWWYKGGSIGGSVLGMATGTSQVGMAAGLANMQAGQAAAGCSTAGTASMGAPLADCQGPGSSGAGSGGGYWASTSGGEVYFGGAAPELPEYAGGKTFGVLRTGQGDTPLVSGWDGGPAPSMPKGSPGFDIVTRTHVEGHAAALMRQTGVSDATLYINNPEICSSCSKLLPSMLGAGRSLNVVLPDGSCVPFEGMGP